MSELVAFLVAVPLLYGMGWLYWQLGVSLYRTLRAIAVARASTMRHPNSWRGVAEGRASVSNGPRYDWAAMAAAEIVNLHVGTDQPKEEAFGRILFIVLEAMYAAERELNVQRFEPSRN